MLVLLTDHDNNHSKIKKKPNYILQINLNKTFDNFTLTIKFQF